MIDDGGTGTNDTERGGFRFEDPLQAEVFARLRNLIGPGPALFYRDACRHMAAQVPMDTVTHQVGHCVREIESALRAVLRSSVVLQPEAGERAPEGASGKKKGESNHKADIRAILAGLDIDEDDDIAQAWLAYAGGLHERAHRHALNPPRPLDKEFVDFFDGMQSVLRVVLARFETKFGSSFRIIDELLAKDAPTTMDAKRLMQEVPNTLVTYRRFFEGIKDERWLEPLREEGFFASPPGPEIDDEGRSLGYPPWPQSRYLVEVAAIEPDKVKEIILEIPSTDNVRVHEDIAEAARAMPPRLAVEVAPKAAEGLDSPSYASALPRNLSGLVAHLAGGGLTEEALGLARELLVLVPQEDHGGEAALLTTRDPRPRFQPPEVYGEVIEACLAPLVDAAGEQTFEVLCDLLEDAIRVSLDLRAGDEAEELPYEDGLYVLRPAIEDSPYNEDRGPLGEMSIYHLLSAVRNAGERIAAADPTAMTRLVETLETKRNETFDRLALHLLRNFPDAPGAPGLIAERLKDKLASSSPGLFHEYALLLRDQFEDLSAEDHEEILRRISVGPPQEELEVMRRYKENE